MNRLFHLNWCLRFETPLRTLLKSNIAGCKFLLFFNWSLSLDGVCEGQVRWGLHKVGVRAATGPENDRWTLNFTFQLVSIDKADIFDKLAVRNVGFNSSGSRRCYISDSRSLFFFVFVKKKKKGRKVCLSFLEASSVYLSMCSFPIYFESNLK